MPLFDESGILVETIELKPPEFKGAGGRLCKPPFALNPLRSALRTQFA